MYILRSKGTVDVRSGRTYIHTMSTFYADFGMTQCRHLVLTDNRDESRTHPLALAASDARIVVYAYHINVFCYSV